MNCKFLLNEKFLLFKKIYKILRLVRDYDSKPDSINYETGLSDCSKSSCLRNCWIVHYLFKYPKNSKCSIGAQPMISYFSLRRNAIKSEFFLCNQNYTTVSEIWKRQGAYLLTPATKNYKEIFSWFRKLSAFKPENFASASLRVFHPQEKPEKELRPRDNFLFLALIFFGLFWENEKPEER